MQTLAGTLAFTVYGVPLANDVGVLEAGIDTQLKPNLTLGVGYTGQLGNDVRDNGLKVNLGWKF